MKPPHILRSLEFFQAQAQDCSRARNSSSPNRGVLFKKSLEESQGRMRFSLRASHEKSKKPTQKHKTSKYSNMVIPLMPLMMSRSHDNVIKIVFDERAVYTIRKIRKRSSD